MTSTNEMFRCHQFEYWLLMYFFPSFLDSLKHYNEWSAMASQIRSLTIIQRFIEAWIKENIKAPRHWPLWGELTSDRWVPHTKGQ